MDGRIGSAQPGVFGAHLLILNIMIIARIGNTLEKGRKGLQMDIEIAGIPEAFLYCLMRMLFFKSYSYFVALADI